MSTKRKCKHVKLPIENIALVANVPPPITASTMNDIFAMSTMPEAICKHVTAGRSRPALAWIDAAPARINAVCITRQDATALYLACTFGHLSLVKALLLRGANPNAQPECSSPLVALVCITQRVPNRLEIVQLLLTALAQVDYTNVNGGTTALSWAFARPTDQFLAKANDQQTALRSMLINHQAVMSKDMGFTIDLSKTLEKESQHRKIHHMSWHWWSFEQGASSDLLVRWLDGGGDPDEVLPWGESLIARACAAAKPDLVRLLLSRGAEVHGANAHGFTPLHCAVAPTFSEAEGPEWGLKRLECLRLLLCARARTDAQSHSGITPLFIAQAIDSENATVKMLRKMLEEHAPNPRPDKIKIAVVLRISESGCVSAQILPVPDPLTFEAAVRLHRLSCRVSCDSSRCYEGEDEKLDRRHLKQDVAKWMASNQRFCFFSHSSGFLEHEMQYRVLDASINADNKEGVERLVAAVSDYNLGAAGKGLTFLTTFQQCREGTCLKIQAVKERACKDHARLKTIKRLSFNTAAAAVKNVLKRCRREAAAVAEQQRVARTASPWEVATLAGELSSGWFDADYHAVLEEMVVAEAEAEAMARCEADARAAQLRRLNAQAFERSQQAVQSRCERLAAETRERLQREAREATRAAAKEASRLKLRAAKEARSSNQSEAEETEWIFSRPNSPSDKFFVQAASSSMAEQLEQAAMAKQAEISTARRSQEGQRTQRRARRSTRQVALREGGLAAEAPRDESEQSVLDAALQEAVEAEHAIQLARAVELSLIEKSELAQQLRATDTMAREVAAMARTSKLSPHAAVFVPDALQLACKNPSRQK